MKGRPITTEEFERMIQNVPKTLYPPRNDGSQPEYDMSVVESWRYYLRGLWWSGFRLAESLELYWDRDDKLCVDFSGRRPMFHIPAELEKGHRDRLLPIAPEFATFLFETPAKARHGRVFDPRPLRPRRTPHLCEARVGKIISNIGKTALIKVDDKRGKVKFASAHDLRKAFGLRWSMRVMPSVLMQLMRHENIETTMKYYVGREAEATADVLWEAVSDSVANDFANIDQDREKSLSHEKAESLT